ncbi:uncharacterized protein TM35_000172160 [Trypanosoma theileri]|uniref:Uncharacterized protein n=1 Tax=Trypanosoma theileri TaxID=67003 RepID=A0A1X0NUF5_9TRYP|nr:uncharacterized protein TM35_000172160 [Trypanosoma theileri]ORC88344.1 hypothetical protein TM35_000172160 [Trypanosoma theileri]
MHAPEWPTFENQYLYPLFTAIHDVGWEKGALAARWDELNRSYAEAVEDYQQRAAVAQQRVAEENQNISARASAVAEYEEIVNRRSVELQNQINAFAAHLEKANQDLESRDQQLRAREEAFSRREAAWEKRHREITHAHPKKADR